MMQTKTLYDTDFNLWVESQLLALEEQRYTDLDLPHLLEELEGLTQSDKRALRSYLRVLLTHLLKWQYQPECQSTSWRSSINNARIEIREILADSPSLRNYLSEVLPKAYQDAQKQATDETVPLNTFAAQCPYPLEQA